VATELSQNEEDGETLTATIGDDAKPKGQLKPALRLDHIHEVGTGSTMSAFRPRTPADEAPSSSLEKEDYAKQQGLSPPRRKRK